MPENQADVIEVDEGLFWSWRTGLKNAYETLILRSALPIISSAKLGGEPSRHDVLRAIQWLRRAPRSMGLHAIEEAGLSIDSLRQRFLMAVGPRLVLFVFRGELVVLSAIFEEGVFVRVIKSDGTEVRLTRIALHDKVTSLLATETASLEQLFSAVPRGSAVFRRLQKSNALVSDAIIIQFEFDSSYPIVKQLSAAGAWRALAFHLLISLAQVAATLGSISVLGESLADGRIDAGRILGWSLLAASDAPLQYLASRQLAQFSIAFAAAVKKRLLEGTFFIDEHAVRASGFGELLTRMNEANIVEQLSLNELSGAALAVFEIVGAAILLAFGAQRILAVSALVLFVIGATAVIRANVIGYRSVFRDRIRLTDDLVDKIIGHRTRAVQQHPSQRHVVDDSILSDYGRLAQSWDVSRSAASIMARVWLVVGALVLSFAMVLGAPLRAMIFTALGILLMYRALVALFPAVERFAQWHSAWRGFRDLLEAGTRRERPSRTFDFEDGEGNLASVLSMSAVSFAYQRAGRPILADANLQIRTGEKILLEGRSGSGKTTLVKLIAGEQRALGGVILVGGTDRFSVSDADWRKKVASAPQFHENHIFANTFAFNLDPWGEPGFASREAVEICNELGLGPLLERMPQGYAQIIGETGWQLSHGERSRLFIARALLQKAELFLFDENFGALDPESLIQALECVRRRAKTLIVIAHT